MIAFGRPDIRPVSGARRRARRVGAVALVAMSVAYHGALIGLLSSRVGLPAAAAYALVVAAMVRLTWRRVSDAVAFGTLAVFVLSVVAFVVLGSRLGDPRAPGYPADAARVAMTWRIGGGLFAFLVWPPAVLRRLWRGPDEARPS